MSFEAFKLKGGFIDGPEVLNLVRKFIGQVLWQGSRTGPAFFLEQQAPGTRGPSGFAVLRGLGCNKWRAVRRLRALAAGPNGSQWQPTGSPRHPRRPGVGDDPSRGQGRTQSRHPSPGCFPRRLPRKAPRA